MTDGDGQMLGRFFPVRRLHNGRPPPEEEDARYSGVARGCFEIEKRCKLKKKKKDRPFNLAG